MLSYLSVVQEYDRRLVIFVAESLRGPSFCSGGVLLAMNRSGKKQAAK